MKKASFFLSICFTLMIISGAVYGAAPGEYPKREAWIGLSIYDPVQYPDRTFSIRGVRVNALYGVGQDLTGLDLGLMNELEGGMNGFQLGVNNRVAGRTSGVQTGIFRNDNPGSFDGVQFSLVVNRASGRSSGVQFSLYNRAEHISGVQFGLLNRTDSLNGVQIGLFNLKQDVGRGIPKSFPVRGFPVVNWTFD